MKRSRIAHTMALSAVAALLAACSSNDSVGPKYLSPSVSYSIPSQPGPNFKAPDVEYFEVCKDYTNGSGPQVTVDVQIDAGDNGSIDGTGSFQLDHGQCKDIWLIGARGDRVYVTEQAVIGYSTTVTKLAIENGTPVSYPPVSGYSANGLVAGNAGVTVIFENTPLPPPPPPQGGEGCTPGYWKQSQHFDSWTAPYTTTTLFSAVFENAFPGKTLLDVLNLGGGGLDALGRHTVAALLNAASSGVSYDLSTTEVINEFNATYPGSKTDYNTQKDRFERFNTQGCPLN